MLPHDGQVRGGKDHDEESWEERKVNKGKQPHPGQSGHSVAAQQSFKVRMDEDNGGNNIIMSQERQGEVGEGGNRGR